MNGHWEGFIEVPGGRLYSEADGDGPAVVLIHAGVAHLRMWDEQVAAWQDRYRVIRYDTRGFGRSRVEDVPYSNRADVGAVMDHHGAASAHVLGLSRGALIALDFTVENPQRVKSLTWVAGGVRGYEFPDDPRDVAVYEQTQVLEAAKDWEAIVELETQLWTDGPDQPSDRVDPEVRRLMKQWNLESYRAEQQANQAIPPEIEAAQLLDRLTMPVLLVWGTLDVTSTAQSGEKLAQDVPGARKHVFEGVAHMVNLERPREFNELVGDFLDEAEKVAVSGGGR
jgi:pimeloyl-ACP methyl ester carboxylesterase